MPLISTATFPLQLMEHPITARSPHSRLPTLLLASSTHTKVEPASVSLDQLDAGVLHEKLTTDSCFHEVAVAGCSCGAPCCSWSPCSSLRPLQQIPPRPEAGELLWRDTGEIHWRMLASRSGSILAGYLAGSTGEGYSA